MSPLLRRPNHSPAPHIVRVRQIKLFVETGPRVGNKYGDDLFSHILWMRLDGLTITEMAEEIGCSKETISDCIELWQTQVEQAFGGADKWQPRRRNPRRWANKPTPKIPV